MRTRKDIIAEINVLYEKLSVLEREEIMFSDDDQQYKETVEIRNGQESIVGRIYWKQGDEQFADIVKIDGDWLV